MSGVKPTAHFHTVRHLTPAQVARGLTTRLQGWIMACSRNERRSSSNPSSHGQQQASIKLHAALGTFTAMPFPLPRPVLGARVVRTVITFLHKVL